MIKIRFVLASLRPLGNYVQVFGPCRVRGSIGTARSFRGTVIHGCRFPTVRTHCGSTGALSHPEAGVGYSDRGFRLPAFPKFRGNAAPRRALVRTLRRIARWAARTRDPLLDTVPAEIYAPSPVSAPVPRDGDLGGHQHVPEIEFPTSARGAVRLGKRRLRRRSSRVAHVSCVRRFHPPSLYAAARRARRVMTPRQRSPPPAVTDIPPETEPTSQSKKSNRAAITSATSSTRTMTIRGIMAGGRIIGGLRTIGTIGDGRGATGHRYPTRRPNIPIKRAMLRRPKSHRSLQRNPRHGHRKHYQELPKKVIRKLQ